MILPPEFPIQFSNSQDATNFVSLRAQAKQSIVGAAKQKTGLLHRFPPSLVELWRTSRSSP
jgi:hypothetical protein